MHELMYREWPYQCIRPEEFEVFDADMRTYYRQLVLSSPAPPNLDSIVGSPDPFFFDLMNRRHDLLPLPIPEMSRFIKAQRSTREFHEFQDDVLTYFRIHRYTHDHEHVKGGGFTCLNS